MKIMVLMYDVTVARGWSHYRRHCLDWNAGYDHNIRGYSRSKGCTAECGNLQRLAGPSFQNSQVYIQVRGWPVEVVVEGAAFELYFKSWNSSSVREASFLMLSTGPAAVENTSRHCSSPTPTRTHRVHGYFLLPFAIMLSAAIQ